MKAPSFFLKQDGAPNARRSGESVLRPLHSAQRKTL